MSDNDKTQMKISDQFVMAIVASMTAGLIVWWLQNRQQKPQ